MVAGGEVAARPPQHRDAQPADRFHDVLPVAVFVGKRAAFLVNPAVNAASQMLGEIAEQVGVHLADLAVGIDPDARLRRLGVKRESQQQQCRKRFHGRILSRVSVRHLCSARNFPYRRANLSAGNRRTTR